MDIATFKVTSEKLSAEEYLKLIATNKDKIESVKIVPPHLGGKDFGKLEVTYKTPLYKTFNE